MIDRISFTVPGDPRGKGRPRIVKIGQFSRMANDTKTVNYENLVALAAETAMGNKAPFECPLTMTLTARIMPAASVSAKVRAAMLSGAVPPTKKPDLDNIVKIICDGCNKVAYRDDVLIVEMRLSKVYSALAGVDVVIAPWVDRTAQRARWGT